MVSDWKGKRFQTDPEVIAEYALRLGLSEEDAKFLLSEAVESIRYVLNKNGSVNIRKFGLFHLKVRKRARMYNPKTGQYYKLPMGYVIKFVATASLKSLINNKVKDNVKKAYEIGESGNA